MMTADQTLVRARDALRAERYEEAAYGFACYIAATEKRNGISGARGSARAPKPAADPLSAKVTALRGRKACSVAAFVCRYADGSETSQRVSFAKPAERWAAAAQACELLRRIRGARRIAGPPPPYSGKALNAHPIYCAGPNGIAVYRDWRGLLASVYVPELASITCSDTGETFTVRQPMGIAA